MIDVVYEWLKSKNENIVDFALCFVAGLVWGFVWSLTWGLAGVLVAGLVWGLVVGLVVGLALCLVAGLVSGLVAGLVWGLGTLAGIGILTLVEGNPHWVIFLVAVIILAELLFILDPKKPSSKDNKLAFTAKRKACNLLAAAILVFVVNGTLTSYGLVEKWAAQNMKAFNELMNFVGWGTAILVVTIIAFTAWIALNSLKYERRERERSWKRRR